MPPYALRGWSSFVFGLLLAFTLLLHGNSYNAHRFKNLAVNRREVIDKTTTADHYSQICRLNTKIFMGNMDWDPKAFEKGDFNEDYYSVLEVSPDADSKVLKKAYYKMVFKYHPDNKEGDKAKDICNKQMMVINAAYKVLKDIELRATYDRKRQMGYYGNSAGVKEKSNTSTQTKSATSATSSKQASKATSTYSTTSSQSSQQKSSGPSFKTENDNKNFNSDSNESLFNVISDIWSDIRSNGGTFILQDILDVLEEQFEDTNRVRYSSNSNPNSTSKQKYTLNLDEDINKLRSSISNMQAHYNKLQSLYTDEEREIIKTKNIKNENIDEQLLRFKKIETMKGLGTRLKEVQTQIRILQKQLTNKIKERDNNSGNSNDETFQDPNTFSKSYSSNTQQQRAQSIELELDKLKKNMGLK